MIARPFLNEKQLQVLYTALLSLGMALLFFLWEGHVGLNLADEGFLWYGAQRLLHGEVPIRDFMAYDPGRYYWSAALMGLLHDHGVMALRLAAMLFQGVGVGLALWAWMRTTERPSPLFAGLIALTWLIWMLPRHKFYDISLCLTLIGSVTLLLHRPNPRQYFWTGLAIGLIAVFGRNHGAYALFSGLAGWGYLAWKGEPGSRPWPALGRLLAGVGVGYLPVLAMLALVPGFAPAFWESLRALVGLQGYNQLPAPWPWLAPWGHAPLRVALRETGIGLFFLATLGFGCLGLPALFILKARAQRVPPALAAAMIIALPYLHVVLARGGVFYLTQGIYPLLAGAFVWISGRKDLRLRWGLAAALCAASLGVTLPLHPGWTIHQAPSRSVKVGGDRLRLDTNTSLALEMLERMVKNYAPGERSFVTTPYWPAAYAIWERRSPLWEIYALFPRDPEFQQREIQRLVAADPGFVWVIDQPRDGLEALRYRYTHPLIDQYFREHFEPLTSFTPIPEFQVYRSRSVRP